MRNGVRLMIMRDGSTEMAGRVKGGSDVDAPLERAARPGPRDHAPQSFQIFDRRDGTPTYLGYEFKPSSWLPLVRETATASDGGTGAARTAPMRGRSRAIASRTHFSKRGACPA